jgi:hypothetical protein
MSYKTIVFMNKGINFLKGHVLEIPVNKRHRSTILAEDGNLHYAYQFTDKRTDQKAKPLL